MNLPTLDSLKIFCDVVGQRSFRLGAQMNNVSQSAASQAVAQLEKRFGVRLLDRATRPSGLTAEGKIFYEGCGELLLAYRELEAKIHSTDERIANRLEVASIYSIVLYDMSSYSGQFAQKIPNGSLHFKYLHPEDVYLRVFSGESEIGLMSFPRPNDEIKAITWRIEPMILVCAPKHPLADRKDVALDELDGLDFVAFSETLGIWGEIDSFLSRYGVTVNVTSAFDNIEFIKRGVEATGGISILPEPTVRSELIGGKLKTAHVKGLNLTRRMCVIYRRNADLSQAARTFIDILTEKNKPSKVDIGETADSGAPAAI